VSWKLCDSLSGVGGGTALQAGRPRVRFPMGGSLEFFSHLILPAALMPRGQLNLWQKWVPGILPGGKDGRCVGLATLQPSCTDCLEILGASTSWNPKGPSRPVVGELYLYHNTFRYVNLPSGRHEGMQLYSLLTSALCERYWSASRCGRFSAGEDSHVCI
jgi:hypothetical protein